MDFASTHRILRQHLLSDQLLGIDSVPKRSISTKPPLSSVPKKPSPANPENVIKSKPLSREKKTSLLGEMAEKEVSICTKCELHHSRTQTVFGDGDVDTPIMFVGEGPGANEDEQGKPFVGRSGKLLTDMIKAIGYDREQVYIANVVKCRPPNNRTPNAQEAATCGQYLQRQISIIQPKVIVTLGGPAAKLLLNPKQGITRIRGTWHEYGGVDPAIPVMPTFHPAYLLRSYTKENRGKVWSDLKAAVKKAKS